jgi:hypothetical protein
MLYAVPLTAEHTKTIIGANRQFGRNHHEYSADLEEATGRDHERDP